MRTHSIKQGARAPYLRGQITDANGPMSLSGCTVTFRMWKHKAKERMINDGAITVIDSDTGIVEYRWAEGDTDEPGLYLAVFWVVKPGTIPEGAPSQGYIEVSVEAVVPASV